ncbi:helix-turn-helix domain-containing protein [Paenibacillus allorhizosphaerae]|uniref:HTH-type transcriptional activator RhaS n=1 Tax=Paenibacillus allorhizosphaerae TaxID=2849866 RepID=A0ABM8VII7_9BACL|nr:helix-turn-helix domain-containing protein [Paenibacillus allorhizosphaerae]CAG7644228.1 HTH-type transcriptional activator RhaS [Paenibacillus allorhizosphaerae]
MIQETIQRTAASRSLFFKLLTSFIVIIVLLVSFNFVSYRFFLTNIQGEIIKNNSLNLNATVNNYEKHLNLVRNLGLSLYFNDKAPILSSGQADGTFYDVVYQVRKDLQQMLQNPLLFLNNMIYFFSDRSVVIEKDGSSSTEAMFTKFYKSDQYTPDFWKAEIGKPLSFKVYPSATFVEQGLENQVVKGTFMPLLIKNSYNSQFAIIAFLDSAKLYDAFFQPSLGNRFFISNSDGQLLFSASGETDSLSFPSLPDHQGFVKKGNNYYFYQKGVESGFTYLSIIPNERIASQIVRMNILLAMLLVAAIVISIGVSIVFSLKVNNPIANIVRSIQQLNFSASPRSRIKEFDLISDQLSDMFKRNQDINTDLNQKNSFLKYYAYINKIKMIHTQMGDGKLQPEPNKPFMLVLFQLSFLQRFQEELEVEQNRASYYIREFIQSHFAEYYKDCLTFQVERDQILTMIFPEDAGGRDVTEILQFFKQVFDMDKKYCLITVAFSPVHRDSSEFTDAYEYLLHRIKLRKLGEETQIITEEDIVPEKTGWSPQEEQEFTANLLAGNENGVLQLVKRTLHSMHRKGATAAQFAGYAAEVIQKVDRAFDSLRLEMETAFPSYSPYDQIRDCYQFEHYERFMSYFLASASALIKKKKAETDYITGFVIEYVEAHYREDLSLDLLADKLNISPAYLSTYFKEKKGTNFSDYVNTFRIRKAQELLLQTDLKIQDVSLLVGYQSVNSFIRMFKKSLGVPPGEFRKANEEWGQA